MKCINVKAYKLENKQYLLTYNCDDLITCNEHLLDMLMYKFIFKSNIKRTFKDVCNYDGTRTLTVYENYEGKKYKYIYLIKS